MNSANRISNEYKQPSYEASSAISRERRQAQYEATEIAIKKYREQAMNYKQNISKIKNNL
jgi:hypothetical protein